MSANKSSRLPAVRSTRVIAVSFSRLNVYRKRSIKSMEMIYCCSVKFYLFIYNGIETYVTVSSASVRVKYRAFF